MSFAIQTYNCRWGCKQLDRCRLVRHRFRNGARRRRRQIDACDLLRASRRPRGSLARRWRRLLLLLLIMRLLLSWPLLFASWALRDGGRIERRVAWCRRRCGGEMFVVCCARFERRQRLLVAVDSFRRGGDCIGVKRLDANDAFNALLQRRRRHRRNARPLNFAKAAMSPRCRASIVAIGRRDSKKIEKTSIRSVCRRSLVGHQTRVDVASARCVARLQQRHRRRRES